jgi:radical SAM-linked protein
MARPVPSGPPPAPIVQRLTIRYAKRGRMRFASHRDVARAIERGVRKAGLPVAYSAGFSPHPKISYSGGAPTGSASEAEYLELSVTRRCEPADIGRLLDAALPDGIDVVEVVEADSKSAGLMLEASEWEVVLPGVAPAAAVPAVRALLALPSAIVERLTSKGTRQLDARAALISLSVVDDVRRAETGTVAGCAILRMTVRQMTPAVRPEDVLAALRQSSALAPESPALVTRLWQGPVSGLAADQTGMTVNFEAAGPAVPPLASEAVPASPSVPAAAGGQSGLRESGLRDPELSQHACGQPASELPAAEQHRPEIPGLAPHGPQARPEQYRPERTTDKALCLDAQSADLAPAGQVRANEQLPRGTQGQLADQRAREPYGRDFPDARNRATERTAGTA